MPSPYDARPSRPTATLLGRPVRPRLAGFPIAFFTAALLTDIAYAQTAYLQWQYFSIWLITAGLVTGGLAGAAGLVDWWGGARQGGGGMALGLLIWLLSFVNAMVHSRDGWTAVVPDGLILSAVVALLLAVRSWFTGPMLRRTGSLA